MTLRISIAAMMVALATTPLYAQPPGPVVPGAIAAKLSLRFDFEQDVDRDGFPDEWRAVGGRHPQNIRERRDVTQCHGGGASLVVAPDGQANIYETARAWPFDARLSYRLTGWIRTRDLPNSGLRATTARIELAGFQSDDLPPVFTVSTPGVSGSTDWTEVGVDIPRDVTRPFRTVRLRLITDGPALSGKVWFDDVALAPKPTVCLSAGRHEGFLAPDDARVARVSLDTLIDGPSTVLLRFYDPDGVLASAKTVVVTPSAGFTAETSLDLGVRAFGLYRLEADLLAPGRAAVSCVRRLMFWPGLVGAPRRDVGVDAGNTKSLDSSPWLVRAPFGTVQVALSDAEDSARAAQALARLRQVPGEIEPVVVLDRPPDALVHKLFKDKLIADASVASWRHVLTLDPALWSDDLAAIVKPIASRVLYYQVGAGNAEELSSHDIARAVSQIRAALGPITWDRRIALVVTGREAGGWLEAASADVLVLDATTLTPDEMESRAARLNGKSAELWIIVGSPRQVRDPKDRPDELFERLVRAKAAGADRIITPAAVPREALSAAATFARELGGKKFTGRLATRTPAYCFGTGAEARVAVLPRGSGSTESVPLGAAPLRIDLDGNLAPATLSQGEVVLIDSGRPCLMTNVTVPNRPAGN